MVCSKILLNNGIFFCLHEIPTLNEVLLHVILPLMDWLAPNQWILMDVSKTSSLSSSIKYTLLFFIIWHACNVSSCNKFSRDKNKCMMYPRMPS